MEGTSQEPLTSLLLQRARRTPGARSAFQPSPALCKPPQPLDPMRLPGVLQGGDLASFRCNGQPDALVSSRSRNLAEQFEAIVKEQRSAENMVFGCLGNPGNRLPCSPRPESQLVHPFLGRDDYWSLWRSAAVQGKCVLSPEAAPFADQVRQAVEVLPGPRFHNPASVGIVPSVPCAVLLPGGPSVHSCAGPNAALQWIVHPASQLQHPNQQLLDGKASASTLDSPDGFVSSASSVGDNHFFNQSQSEAERCSSRFSAEHTPTSWPDESSLDVIMDMDDSDSCSSCQSSLTSGSFLASPKN